MLSFRIVVPAFMLAVIARPAAADVTGPATVIDGDTLVVAGERIRLEGIDAPELHQTCTAYGQQWACGRTSADWLKEHLDGRQVECIGHARDRCGRLLAVCYTGGESINEWIVREGWALDFRRYSTDYLPEDRYRPPQLRFTLFADDLVDQPRPQRCVRGSLRALFFLEVGRCCVSHCDIIPLG